MTNKIILDLEQLKKEREMHQQAIERIDCILSYYFKNKTTEEDKNIQNVEPAPEGGRMKRAVQLCAEYLYAGNVVSSTKQFLKMLEEKGVKLSRAGLGLAFKDSNIYFDSDSRTWKVKDEYDFDI